MTNGWVRPPRLIRNVRRTDDRLRRGLRLPSESLESRLGGTTRRRLVVSHVTDRPGGPPARRDILALCGGLECARVMPCSWRSSSALAHDVREMRLANAPDASEKSARQALGLVQMHQSAVQATTDPHRLRVTMRPYGITGQLHDGGVGKDAWLSLDVAL